MNRLKSIFISAWNTLLVFGIVRAIYQVSVSSDSATAWWLVLTALAAPALFFVWLFAFNVARTRRATLLALSVSSLCSMMVLVGGGVSPEMMLWLAISVLGMVLYEWWYSSFGVRSDESLAVGSSLPALEFERADGSVLITSEIGKPLLMIFFRGNWCPLCMAQIKEVADQYRQLADIGVEVMLISPQSHGNTEALAKRFDAPMTFLIDKDLRVAAQLGIKAEKGLPSGLEALGYDSDTVMPTVVMTDAKGKIIYTDLTSNYRIRPEPEDFFRVLSSAGI